MVKKDDFEDLRMRLKKAFSDKADSKVKAQIIAKLVHRVDVGVDGVKIHYHVGDAHLKGVEPGGDKPSGSAGLWGPQKNLCGGSNSLTNGARDWT